MDDGATQCIDEEEDDEPGYPELIVRQKDGEELCR